MFYIKFKHPETEYNESTAWNEQFYTYLGKKTASLFPYFIKKSQIIFLLLKMYFESVSEPLSERGMTEGKVIN